MSFETKTIALTNTPVDLAADTDIALAMQATGVYVYVQNTGNKDVFHQEADARPYSTTNNAHFVTPGGGNRGFSTSLFRGRTGPFGYGATADVSR